MRNKREKSLNVDKKRKKVEEAEAVLAQQLTLVEEKVKTYNETLSKARASQWKYKKASRDDAIDGSDL
jgi:hypothetical protein